MEFNAHTFAKSWLSVAVAAGDDKERPALHRTTLMEEYDDGVRLVSTDGYLLLRAWVPFLDRPPQIAEPPLDELPNSVAVCADKDGRVKSLMAYTLNQTRDEDNEVWLSTEIVQDDDDVQATLEGLAASRIKMQVLSRYAEAIESPIYEGTFPNWRPLFAGHVWHSTPIVGLSAYTIGKMAKLASLWGKASVEFLLGGKVGVTRINIVNTGGDHVNVDGLVMPIRLATDVPESAEVAVESEIDDFRGALDAWLAATLQPTTDDDPADPADDAE